ncbi:MAG: prolyl oligopeptidase family serine peptidase [Saprospiraceae bacterium]
MKQWYFLFLVLFTIGCATSKYTQGINARTFKSADGTSLPYNIFYPDEYKNTKDKIPLFIWLHGAGERGDDNVSQLIHIVPYLASDMVQSKYPSIILAPQCPKDEYWAPVKRFEWSIINGGAVTPPMERLIKLLEQILKDPKIDKNRIYIGGLSMGGFGTYDLLSRKPEWFAAAVPICGGADLNKAKNYKDIPLWIFHGAKDTVVPVTLSKDIFQVFTALGGNAKYKEYPEGGHDIWNMAIREPELVPWLFAQNKSTLK